jgi:hypothetical protein
VLVSYIHVLSAAFLMGFSGRGFIIKQSERRAPADPTEKISMKIKREKILNRIDGVSMSASLFARLCDPDCFDTMAITEWLGYRMDKLPPRVEKRVGEVFVVMEQVLAEMGKPPEQISPGELANAVEKRCRYARRAA